MGSNVKVGLNSNAKITNLAAYRRKKLMQRRNKFWLIAIGVCLVLLSTAVYFGSDIQQSVNDTNVLVTPYVSQ
jgi:hypothetical protein